MKDRFGITVAGLRLVFESEEVVFSERAKSFRGFADPIAGELPPVSETLIVRVRLAQGIVLPSDKAKTFAGEATPEEKECLPYDWLLAKKEDGSEEVAVVFDSSQPYKAARAIIRTDRVELDLEPEVETAEVDPYVFPLFNLMLSRLLLPRGGFLIHSSCVFDPKTGCGFLFTAPSGTGKSTMAKIWEGEGARVLNDDMLAVRQPARPGDPPLALPIPMPYYSQHNDMVRLKAVFLLSQSPENRYEMVGGAMSVARILSNVVQQPLDEASVRKLLDNVSRFASAVGTVSLGFKPDAEVVELVRNMFRAR